MSAILVLCTCPDEAAADRIAGALVEERLAACVNRLAGVVSTYRWEGEVRRGSESLLLIKTTVERFAALRQSDRKLTIQLTDTMARVFASAPADGALSQPLLGFSLGLIDAFKPARHLLAEQMMYGWR